MKFNVGDRVKCISEHDNNVLIINKIGKVLYSNELSSCIEFDDFIDGHADRGGKDGHVWNIRNTKLTLAKPLSKILSKLLGVRHG